MCIRDRYQRRVRGDNWTRIPCLVTHQPTSSMDYETFGAAPIARGPASGITFQDLQTHFDQPLAEVARKLNVCTTFFKKICRHFGIKRWPFRKLKSLEKKIALLESKAPGGKSNSTLATYHQQVQQIRAFARTDSDVDSESNEGESDLAPSPARSSGNEVQKTKQQQPVDADAELCLRLEAEVCLRLSSMLKRNLGYNNAQRVRGTADMVKTDYQQYRLNFGTHLSVGQSISAVP
eukprot:TRINITY_DN2085_c0_g1_i3.p1 TRINITY_DN2085_c0_g1~~TRINITY_DN2085_c0_g1_i3.p1  ORF type:complete len:235 (+),score=33.21 TRINITY_DN2085_c0_g1_i3:169-873(+)